MTELVFGFEGYALKKEAYKGIPFVNVDVEARTTSYWSVEASGDWNTDFSLGVEYAQLALSHVKRTDLPSVMYKIVADMPKREDFGGVEAGFIDHLTTLALKSIGRTPRSFPT